MIEKIDFQTGEALPTYSWVELAPWELEAHKAATLAEAFFGGYLPPLFQLKTRYPKEFCKPIPQVKLCR